MKQTGNYPEGCARQPWGQEAREPGGTAACVWHAQSRKQGHLSPSQPRSRERTEDG